MKKLRCENCGGELVIDETSDYATCSYCKTKYKLNEDKTVTIKIDEDIKNMYMETYKNTSKVVKPVMIIFFIIFFTVFGLILFGIISGISSGNKTEFNHKYEIKKGTQTTTTVGLLLDDISSNNQQNKRKITVVYNNKNYVDSDEIYNLKKELTSGGYNSLFNHYEVRCEYDSKGYINKIKIENNN